MGGVAEKVVRLSRDISIAAGNRLPGLLLRAQMPGDIGFRGIIFQFKRGKQSLPTIRMSKGGGGPRKPKAVAWELRGDSIET